LRLKVSVDQTGSMDNGQCSAQVLPQQGGLAIAEGTVCGQDLFKSLALDVLHPQSKLTAVLLNPVNGDNVGVLDSGEDSSFLQHPCGNVWTSGSRIDQLECDIGFEQDVMGTPDFAKCPLSKLFDQPQVAPTIANSMCRSGRNRGLRLFAVDRPVHAGDGINQEKVAYQLAFIGR
jgi:hypothetical protein